MGTPPLTTDSHPRRVVTTHDGSRTLQLGETDVTWRSTSGAASESRAVFLENSGMDQPRLPDGRTDRAVLEIGFGTGLNFLLTADRFATLGSGRLEYHACDMALVPPRVLNQLAYRSLLDQPELYDQLTRILSRRSALAAGRIEAPFPGNTRLVLRLGDARRLPLTAGRFDAVYLDPFAPDVNPQLWELPFLRQLYASLRPGGRLVSYCVKRMVRDRLQQCGFRVRTVPGPPGGKREVLRAGVDRAG